MLFRSQEALLALPGIGDWTVQLLALRVLGWPDAFPATDIGLLKALGFTQARDAPQALALAEPWRPWRSYAVIALWRALESGAPTPEATPTSTSTSTSKLDVPATPKSRSKPLPRRAAASTRRPVSPKDKP